jgi:nucleolar protein 56
MRIKEWFGWHFPELGRIIKDNYVYVRIVKLIEQRKNLSENQKELEPKLNDITLDNEITKNIIEACSVSMGSDINEGDLLNIKYFTEKVESLIKYRENLANYLVEKMKKLAPNTSALVGEIVAARLISHAGSLATLSKYPASTIQILGAEKALFRALKTRSKTPKYGLLYHSSFIGKAKLKNKGKISRYLANKIAMCARIDYFSNERYNEYGNELKNQIEERLNYLDTGVKPRKNLDVMKKIEDKIKKKEIENKEEESEKKEEKFLNKKKKKKESEKKKDESSDDESSESEKEKPIKKKKIKEESDDESSQSKSSVEIIKSKSKSNKKKK